jgi:hypothetical protein
MLSRRGLFLKGSINCNVFFPIPRMILLFKVFCNIWEESILIDSSAAFFTRFRIVNEESKVLGRLNDSSFMMSNDTNEAFVGSYATTADASIILILLLKLQIDISVYR